MGELFSGARQGVRYRGNGGTGTVMYDPWEPEEPHGQTSLFDNRSMRRIHPESVEYGHTATQRAHDPTQWNGQMALPGTPKPTNPTLHRLRQQNPHLNDYQFKMNSAEAPSKVHAYDAAGNRVGMLKLGYERMDFQSHEGHREVDEIGVAPDHAGKGLGEAMYDLARMRGTKIVHSSERSESGEAFARRVGGPQFDRVRGIGFDDYLGQNPDRHHI